MPDLPIKYGVAIGQTIDFEDCTILVLKAFPGEVRVRVTPKDPARGRATRTVSRAEYDRWIKSAKPAPERSCRVFKDPVEPALIGTWEPAKFSEIKKDDVFILFEPDGTQACEPQVAMSDAKDGNVDAQPLQLPDLK